MHCCLTAEIPAATAHLCSQGDRLFRTGCIPQPGPSHVRSSEIAYCDEFFFIKKKKFLEWFFKAGLQGPP